MIMISKGNRSPWAAQIMQRSDGRWTTKVIETAHKLKDNAERVSVENIKTKPLVKREVENYGVVLCSTVDSLGMAVDDDGENWQVSAGKLLSGSHTLRSERKQPGPQAFIL